MIGPNSFFECSARNSSLNTLIRFARYSGVSTSSIAVNRSSCLSFCIGVTHFPLLDPASVWVLLSRNCLLGDRFVIVVCGFIWSNFLLGAGFLFLISISKVFLFGLFLVVIAINFELCEFKFCLMECNLFLAVLRQKACCSFSVFALACVTSLCSNCFLSAN